MDSAVSVLALIGLVVALATASSSSNPDDGFLMARPKMGHLARTNSLGDMYRMYFRVFIEPTISSKQLAGSKSPLDDNDWRVYSPMNDKCVDFLRAFSVYGYKLLNIEDFILLDACLGYLYDEHNYRWSDNAHSEQSKLTINALIRDENLREIYRATQLETITDTDSLACLKTLLINVMSLRLDDSTTNCNKHWLEQYNEYANCKRVLKVTSGGASSDSYIDLVSDVVKQLAVRCFYNEMEIIHDEMDKWYQGQLGLARLAKGFKATFGVANKAELQAVEQRWPRKLLKVFQVVLGKPSTSDIDLNHVKRMASGLKQYDSKVQQEFTKNLASYANRKFTSKDNYDDPDGSKQYNDLMIKLCQPFSSKTPLQTTTLAAPATNNQEIQQQSSQMFDFNGVIMQLLTMLVFEDYFGLNDQILMSELEAKGNSTLALYTANFMCRFIGLTVGQVNSKKELKSNQLKADYHVEIAHNADIVMQLWPFSTTAQLTGDN